MSDVLRNQVKAEAAQYRDNELAIEVARKRLAEIHKQYGKTFLACLKSDIAIDIDLPVKENPM